MSRVILRALVSALLLASGPLAAHEDFRVIGVITKRYIDKNKQDMMEVTYDKKSVVTLWISKLTKVTEKGKPLTIAALKQGASVIVDSYGDEMDYSEALQVQLTPAAK